MKYLLLLLLLPLKLCAQDFTGLWRGSLYNDTTELTLPYEIAISSNKGKLSGYSYTTFLINGKEYTGLKSIKLKVKNDKLLIEDLDLIYNNYPEAPPKGVRMYSVLNVNVTSDSMVLSGLWNTNRTREYLSATGSLHLKRTFEHKDSKLLAKLNSNDIGHSLDIRFLQEIGYIQGPDSLVTTAVVKSEQPPLIQEYLLVRVNEIQEPKEHKIFLQIKTKIQPTKELIAKIDPAKEKMFVEMWRKDSILKSESVVVKSEPVVVKPKPVEIKPVVVKTKPLEIKTDPVVVKTEPIKKPVIQPQPEPEKIEPPITKALPVTVMPPANVVANAATELSKRKTESIQNVTFKSDSLVISLFDNGFVDGDTVSVLMNGQVIIAKAGLKEVAVNKTIYIPTGTDSVQLVMYAENLGSIPPNTGLLVIRDGGVDYEIRFSADMNRNAGIVLRRKR